MKYILTFILSFISCWVCSQSIVVNDIPTLNQLPVNAIHRVFQDSEGYMWYGTVNGLCRDDGYHVQVFRSDINTPQLLDNNLVECITEDKEGKIWFGTDKGAYILDKKDYHVSPLDAPRLKDQYIYRIDSSSDGYVWVSIRGALLKYKPDGTLVKDYKIYNSQGKTFVGGFCEDREGRIIVTYSGDKIYYLDKEKDAFHAFPRGLKNANPTVLIQDREQDYYWLLTWGDGIVRFDPSASQDSMYVYQPLPRNAAGEETGIILYLAQDDVFGYLWGTSSHTLVAFKPQEDGRLEQVDLSHLFPASNRMLNEVIKDYWGNLWVSAFDQPSFIVHFQDDAPRNYPLTAIRERVNCNPAVMALCDAGGGMMWMSQERTGVFLYDLNKDKECCYTDFEATKDLPLDAVKEMAETYLPGGVWIAPVNSRFAYRLARNGMDMKLVNKLDLRRLDVSAGPIQTLREDRKKNLWIGTSNGLYRYALEHEQMTAVSDTVGFVTDILESPTGDIWVCTTNKGLYRVTSAGQYQRFPMEHSFSTMAMTTDGTLWLGTEGGGIYAFYPHSGEWQNYNQKCGMNGDQVNRITTDIFNHLWIDTNQKIIEFNPRNGSFRTYLTMDKNMLLWRLIPTSLCKGKDGNIYFGGIPGICSFTPSNRLESEARPVKTLITNIRVMGSSLILGQQKGRNSLSQIRLQPDDRNLEIDFSSLNHRYAAKVRYAYRLKGVDRNWIYTANGDNSAFYNHLGKGTYTFQVKATDENGLWSKEVTELTIHRLPAFYETWWAYLFYVLMVMGVSGYSLYLYLKRVERKNNEMWSDSEEMMKMRTYLDSTVNLPEPEFAQLDKLLLEKAVKAVEDNLTEPDFDVTALADTMNMSRSTLTRKLKAITGRTPLDFIRNIKMKHARRMLEDKDRSVTEVAATLGYFNRKYFTTCFKEEFGMTPSDFQKSLAENKE